MESQEYYWFDGDTKQYIYPAKKANSPRQSDKTSQPVFAMTPNGVPFMELTGKVIVYFKENLPKSKILDWCEKNQVVLDSQLGIPNNNAWIIITKKGLASLQLANKWKLDPLILKSFPDWHYFFLIK